MLVLQVAMAKAKGHICAECKRLLGMNCFTVLTIDHSLKPLLLVLGGGNVQEKLVVGASYHLQSPDRAFASAYRLPVATVDGLGGI